MASEKRQAMTNYTPPAWAALPAGSHRLSCPHCGKESRRDRTMGVTVEHDGAGVAHCFRCEHVETFRPDQGHRERMARTPRPPAPPPAQKFTSLNEAGRALWRSSHPILPSTPAAAYLQARNCVVPPVAGHLRWLPAHRHPSGYTGPCLVALLTDVVTRDAKSLHFTWIQPTGRKAPVDPPRLLLKSHIKAGSVCRLWPDSSVTYGLAVSEGIETALSLAHAFTPAWAAIDAGNLAALPVLPGVESLLIGCDRDPAGERAADELAERWLNAGATVVITRQTMNDLNDVVQAAAMGSNT